MPKRVGAPVAGQSRWCLNPKGRFALHRFIISIGSPWRSWRLQELYTFFLRLVFLSLLDSPLCQLIWLKYHLTCICFLDMTDMTWRDVIQQNDEAMNSLDLLVCWNSRASRTARFARFLQVIRCHYQCTISELTELTTVVPTSIKNTCNEHRQQYQYQIFSLAKVRSRCRRVLR